MPGKTLIICLQSNTLQDFGGGYSDGWEKMVENCVKDLNESHNFVCPVLDINFRNSSSINKSANSIQNHEGNNNSNLQNTLGISKMGTTLDTSNVRQIHFNWQSMNNKQDDLNEAMKKLLKHVQSDIDLRKEPLILLNDDTKFECYKIKDMQHYLENR